MNPHKYENNVRDVFSALVSDPDVMNGVGAVYFVRKGKSPAKVFLRHGNVYAVENEDVTFSLTRRLETSELISKEDLERLQSGKKPVEKLVKECLSTQVVKEGDMTILVREYFLSMVDDLYLWENVNIEWHPAETYDGITAPQVALSRLIQIITNRYQHVLNQAKEWGFESRAELIEAPFYVTDQEAYATETDHIRKIVLKQPSNTVSTLAGVSGVQIFVLIQTLIDLNTDEKISFTKPESNQLILPNEEFLNEEKAEKTSTEEEPKLTVTRKTIPTSPVRPISPAKTVATFADTPEPETPAEEKATAIEEVEEEPVETPEPVVEQVEAKKPEATPAKKNTASAVASGVIALVKQLKQELSDKQNELKAFEGTLRTYRTEEEDLARRLENVRSLISVKAEEQEQLKAEYDDALQQIKELGINE